MAANRKDWRKGWHIIWAIARKDIADAIKNKTALGIMIGVAFLMISSQALVLLAKGQSRPGAVIYDPGGSAMVRELISSREWRLGLSNSFAEMTSIVSQSPEVHLGFVFPKNFDEQATGGGDPLEIEGYFPHWASASLVTERVLYFEEQLSTAVGHPIRIRAEGNQVYPNPQEIGYSTMISTGIVLGVMTIGLILVPVLMLEEKETHTLAALLVSPARLSHLLLGKSLAGLFYALLASVVVFAFSGGWIVHWWVAISAVLFGSLCTVVAGLLIGSIFENAGTANLWIALIVAFFLLPVFVWGSVAPKLPQILRGLASGFPSLAMSQMIGLSLTKTVAWEQVWPHVIAMTLFILLISTLVGWRVRRMDR